MAEQTKLRYITDEAATTDDFGTHVNIATTLLDTISDKDNKPMTIGLEGSWGSGKSTVVNLMFEGIKNGFIKSKTADETSDSQKNENWKNIEYFYIDVWQHEHSCIKRAILHEMIDKLLARIDIPKVTIFWKEKEKHKKLNSIKNKSKGSYSTSNFTVLTLLFVSLTILTPFSTEVGLKLYEDSNYWSAFAACLPVFSLLIIIFNLLAKLFKREYYIEEQHDTLLSEQVSSTFSNSSIEFKQYFDQILSMIDKKKTLIVFDNLDRIDEKKAKEMWAELQVFMQYRNPGDRNKEKQTRPWIIIPYDIDGIRKIWGEGNDIEEDKKTVKSFLQKTFQVRIHVPKPLESNWRIYLEQQLNKITEDKNLVTEFKGYIESHFIANHQMTPREINTIINQIVIYNNSLTDIIRNRNICDFVVQKYVKLWDDTIFLKQLTSKIGDKTTSLAADESTEDYIKEIAALMYNVSKDESLELFLSKIISNLTEGNKPEYHKKAIVYFAKTHPDSLIDIYFDVLSKTSRLQSILLHVEFIQKELAPILNEQTTTLKNAIQIYGADEFHTVNLLEEFESINTFFEFCEIDNDNAFLQFVFEYLNQAAKIYNSSEYTWNLEYISFSNLTRKLMNEINKKNKIKECADYLAKIENREELTLDGFYNIAKIHRKNLDWFIRIYSIDVVDLISKDYGFPSVILKDIKVRNLNIADYITKHCDILKDKMYDILLAYLNSMEENDITHQIQFLLFSELIKHDKNNRILDNQQLRELLQHRRTIRFIAMSFDENEEKIDTEGIKVKQVQKIISNKIKSLINSDNYTVPDNLTEAEAKKIEILSMQRKLRPSTRRQ